MTHSNTISQLTVSLATAALLLGCGGIEPGEENQPQQETPSAALSAAGAAVNQAGLRAGDATEVARGAEDMAPTDQLTARQAASDHWPTDGLRPAAEEPRVLQLKSGARMYIATGSKGRTAVHDDFTFEMWFRVDKRENQPLARTDGLDISVANSRVRATMGGKSMDSFHIQADEWYHLALVRMNNAVTLYLNGIPMDGVDGDGMVPPGRDMILGGWTSEDAEFSGKIENVLLVPEALYNGKCFTPEQKMKNLDSMVYGFSFDGAHPAGMVRDLSENKLDADLGGDAEVVAGAI